MWRWSLRLSKENKNIIGSNLVGGSMALEKMKKDLVSLNNGYDFFMQNTLLSFSSYADILSVFI